MEAGATFRQVPYDHEAMAALTRLAYEVPPRILITGSLYLAGHVLGLNGTPPG
jgi:dihydrofolate synthase/folylpolyglutamate synthase